MVSFILGYIKFVDYCLYTKEQLKINLLPDIRRVEIL